MKITHRLIFILGLLAGLLANTAVAHSFNLIFIAPFDEMTGRVALDGFLLATGEQDSHEFEESDGHLGGLDSYVFKIDSDATTDKFEAIIRDTAPLFAVVNLVSDTTRELLERHQVVVVDPAMSKFWVSTVANPNRLTAMNGDPLHVKFEQAYGYMLNPDALRGYLSARIIATVVRNASGYPRFSAPKLRLAVEQVLQTTSW